MEERKRPLGSADDMAPPSKRQAVNGSSKSSRDDSGDMKDEAWVEDYTKDAIYRQMLEYKRQVGTLETRLEELSKRSTHHDDHIRVVDAWWLQLLQELQLIAESTVSFQPGSEDQAFPTHTTFKDIQDLELHLVDKSSSIKHLAESIFSRLASARGEVAPNISNLEAQVNTLLANQKDFLVKVARFSSEKEGLSEQLNTATLRYMKAERKLDRFRSTQVQKLEQQALASATARPAASEVENGADGNDSNGDSAALRLALQETTAVTRTQKEQLETALAESKTLQEQLTATKARLTSLTEEDYSHTDVFKMSKARLEDSIKRSNHLEAENKVLQAKVSELSGQRESYKQKLEQEAGTLTGDLEDQLQQSDTTLARIRSTRDELHADVTSLKASKDQERSAIDVMKELVSAKEDRIKALELEVQRLQSSEDVDMTARPDLDSWTLEDLREKYKKLEQDFDSINKELPAVVSGMKKYQALANKKVADFTALEERIAMAVAEKSKADQKYFSVRKFDDTRAEESKRLRTQNTKSSEIISQLKENETQSRTQVSNMEKQLVDLRQTNSSVVAESKRMEASANETLRRYESLKAQITELNNLAKSKDTVTSLAKERTFTLETENEKMKARLDHTSKDRDKWKTKSMSNSSEEEEMLRKLALCSVCRANFKDTVLKTCGHVFCKGCVDDRISNRMRKCPNCSRAFDKLDVMAVHL